MGLRDEGMVEGAVGGQPNAGLSPTELSALAADSDALERLGSVAAKAREAGMSRAADRLAEVVTAATDAAGPKAAVGGAPIDLNVREAAATPSAVAKALFSPDCLAAIGPGECFGEWGRRCSLRRWHSPHAPPLLRTGESGILRARGGGGGAKRQLSEGTSAVAASPCCVLMLTPESYNRVDRTTLDGETRAPSQTAHVCSFQTRLRCPGPPRAANSPPPLPSPSPPSLFLTLAADPRLPEMRRQFETRAQWRQRRSGQVQRLQRRLGEYADLSSREQAMEAVVQFGEGVRDEGALEAEALRVATRSYIKQHDAMQLSGAPADGVEHLAAWNASLQEGGAALGAEPHEEDGEDADKAPDETSSAENARAAPNATVARASSTVRRLGEAYVARHAQGRPSHPSTAAGGRRRPPEGEGGGEGGLEEATQGWATASLPQSRPSTATADPPRFRSVLDLRRRPRTAQLARGGARASAPELPPSSEAGGCERGGAEADAGGSQAGTAGDEARRLRRPPSASLLSSSESQGGGSTSVGVFVMQGSETLSPKQREWQHKWGRRATATATAAEGRPHDRRPAGSLQESSGAVVSSVQGPPPCVART